MKNSKHELEELLANLELRARKQGIPKPYFDWVKDNWFVRGKHLDFDSHKYLVQIYEDQHPDIRYMKSAQTGLTERMITESCWLVDQYKENALYLFPTTGTVSDMVQERIDSPINDSPYLSGVVGRVKQINKKWADKINLKRLSKGFIYFRGSNKPTQITSVSADAIFVDELDRMLMSSVPYFEKRMEHSKRKWQRWASTPTIPNYGIHNKFLESDQCHYNVRCDKCGHIQVLTFWDNVKFDVEGKDIKNERIICSKCEQAIVPWKLEGEWLPTEQSDIRGYFISQLYSSMLDIKKLIKASLKSDEFSIQQFYNQNLGLPYEPKGSKLTDEDIRACVRPYRTPYKDDICFAGIDVGKFFHGVIISEKRLLCEIKTQDYGELVRTLKDYQPKVIVIDALPETRKSQELANDFKGRTYLCYYAGMEQVKDGDWFKADDEKVNTNRTVSLDYSGDLIKRQEIELPENLSQEFIDQCKNIIRVYDDKRGKADYIKLGDDHYRHAFNYSNIAKNIFLGIPEPEIMVI